MFRELTRKKQALTKEECEAVLLKEPRGVLSLLGDDGYPYGVPMNFLYRPGEGRVWFHSGKTGHKTDAIARGEKASFCVLDKGKKRPDHWSADVQSVILFGRIRPVADWRREVMADFCRKYTSDEEYIDGEIRTFGSRTAVYVLEIEQMTGKRVNEA